MTGTQFAVAHDPLGPRPIESERSRGETALGESRISVADRLASM